MFTVTLMTNHAMYLDSGLVANLVEAMKADAPRWLDPNHCAEFDAPKIPKNINKVWESLSAEGVDLVWQKAGDRKNRCCWPTWTAR